MALKIIQGTEMVLTLLVAAAAVSPTPRVHPSLPVLTRSTFLPTRSVYLRLSEESRPTLTPPSVSVSPVAYSGLASVLAVGDVACLIAFAAIGRADHAREEGSALATAAPFIVAWLAAAPPLGAYSLQTSAERSSDNSLLSAALTPLPAIAVAVPAGCAARGLLQGYMPALPFWIVSAIAITVLTLAWRVGYSVAADQLGTKLGGGDGTASRE